MPRQLSELFGGFLWRSAMEGFSALSSKERARLRQEFVQEAGTAFDRLFDPAVQDQLVTFTQREDLAVELGQQLAAKLLQNHVAGDSQVRPTATACCPKCKHPGQRLTKARERLPQRELTTRTGVIVVQREQWKCPKCRVVFFSARPTVATRDGRLQPCVAAEDGAA